jgi:UrcA family protein
MKTSLSLFLLSSLAFAGAAPAEPVAARVQIADLDLGTASGRTTLDSRIRQAAVAACGLPSPADLVGSNGLRRCRTEAQGAAQAQIERALAAAARSNAATLAAR